jgi:hypothetical protein
MCQSKVGDAEAQATPPSRDGSVEMTAFSPGTCKEKPCKT